MTLQEHTIEVTKKAVAEVFRYAKAVPEDKVDWKPLDAGRSVLDLAREFGKTPIWAIAVIAPETLPNNGEIDHAAQKVEMDSWKTIAECEAQCLEGLERFYAVVAALPDERLTETKWLPFEGGRDFTLAEMLDYPRWNFNYHLGQIAYIQTLYGDAEMH